MLFLQYQDRCENEMQICSGLFLAFSFSVRIVFWSMHWDVSRMFCVITVNRETVKLQSLAQADLFMEEAIFFVCLLVTTKRMHMM